METHMIQEPSLGSGAERAPSHQGSRAAHRPPLLPGPYKSPFPGVLGDAVYYRTYSRPYDKADGRTTAMETWQQNAQRCSRFLAKLGDLTPAQEQAIYEYQCRLQVTPPGRVLWAAVEHWVERDGYPNYLGLFNCFPRDTTFITRTGIKTFQDYEAGDSLHVIGIDGTWCDARVVYGGLQPLVKVVLEKGTMTKVLKATPGHRWFRYVDTDTYEETTELAVGDYLLSVNGTRKGERPDPVAVARGIAYSRMTVDSTLSLYGEEVELLPYLLPWVGHNYEAATTNDKGEVTHYKVNCPHEVLVGNYSDVSHTLGYLIGLLTRGYATLGSDGTMVLPVEEQLLPWLGYATSLLGIDMGAPYKNGGGRHYVRLSFPGPYDGMKYLLLKRHREAFKEQTGGSMWRVVSIEPTEAEEVWCLQVPKGEAFLLGGGLYTGNCVGIRPTSWRWFGYNFLLLMMGCGVGELLELDNVSMLPPINSRLPELVVTHLPGTHSTRPEHTTSTHLDGVLTIHVGDSKEGWVDSYVLLLQVCSDPTMGDVQRIEVDLGGVRPQGEPIKGFGGTANPSALPDMYRQVMVVLEGARGRQITTFEAALLENETAKATVAGNIRRSAKWIGYGHDDEHMAGAKDNLWQEAEDGVWVVDPKRDALRMSNISAIFHRKPTLEECVQSVRKQYNTGEGALWYVPPALVRSNVDLLTTQRDREEFERAYTVLGKETARSYLRAKMYAVGRDDDGIERELDHRMLRYGANPCCFVAGTMVLTRTGHYPIETLVDKEGVEVWDGTQWVATTFHITGVDQPVYEVILSDGSSITATGYHKFILDDKRVLTLLELMPGDVLMEHDATPEVPHAPYSGSAYLKGFLLGDGTSAQGGPALHLYPTKEMCKGRLVENCKRFHTDAVVPKPGTFQPLTEVGWRDSEKGWWMQGLPRHKALLPWVTTYRKGLPSECYNWSLEEKAEFIAGYFDADGTAMDTKKAYGYQVTSVSLQLLQDLQLLLRTMGVSSHLNRKGSPGGMRDFNDGYGKYMCNTTYRLCLSQASSIDLSKMVTFSRLSSFSDRCTKYTRRKKVSVVQIGNPVMADKVYCCTVPTNHSVSLSNGKRTGQCEILGHNFVCSLSQVDLSRFDVNSPTLWDDIDAALDTAALIVCALLKKGFAIPELQESREVDPIVAVTLNGVFDFLVNLWGEPWLRWWMAGCPEYWVDPLSLNEPPDLELEGMYDGYHSQLFINSTAAFLSDARDRVCDAVTAYCTEHNLKVPSRHTAMQPSGSKSCLTGGTPACYTPKGMYWVRRVTFRRDHPVALAAIALGYKVVPSTSCKDEHGALLDDPYDERVPEWLIEIPQACTWSSNVGGAYDVAHAPIESQWYLTMAVQEHFVTHNTSVTYEINEGEVETLGKLIHSEIAKGGGHYVSGAIYARDYSPMPRMPYEPITREQYEAMVEDVSGRRNPGVVDDFKELVEYYYNLDTTAEVGPEVGCDGGACALPDVP